MSKQTVSRNWAFVVYKDDCPTIELLRYRIEATGIGALISPLHLGDDETAGKAHWHVILRYSYPLGVNAVNKLVLGNGACYGGGGTALPVSNVVGMTRYLLHLDNPEKEQFPDGCITSVNGAKIVLNSSKEDARNEALQEIEEIILDECICSWLQLLRRLSPELRRYARGYATYLHYLVNDMRMEMYDREAMPLGYFDDDSTGGCNND